MTYFKQIILQTQIDFDIKLQIYGRGGIQVCDRVWDQIMTQVHQQTGNRIRLQVQSKIINQIR